MIGSFLSCGGGLWDGFHVDAPTTNGLVHGGINETAPLVRHWLGVPFAQSPVGNLRFALPQALPANATTTDIDATNFGPNCPQYEATTPSVYNKIIREFFIWGDDGDDCLSVSIWAPLNPTEAQLPVFIWIYGGGDTTGGSTVPYQNPQKWVQRTQAHIVVSLQYRLNFFGNPNGPFGNGSAALGFWDVRLATEWIRDNIAAFGGDPTRMVMWGQSAGAGMTGQQSLAWPNDPIVTGFIQDSGATWGVSSGYTDTLFQNFTYIAEAFGCTGSAANMTACLRTVPQTDIESLIQYRVDADQTPVFSFQSKPDNITTFVNSSQAYVDGHFAKVPKILGHNMDGTSLVALPPYPYDTAPNATAVLQVTLQFRCPAVYEAEYRNSINQTTYRFMYLGNFTNISPYWWMGPYHSSELPMIFGTYGDFRGPGTAFEQSTSEAMQDLYLAFARDPVNGPANLGWPKYSENQIEIFGNGSSPATPVDKTEINAACADYYTS
ncbi:Alpha/Beta hydrolase protein [Exophiala viscosa]|uniref:Alpha/Beta hydrolase protein n=1 Tax=Exophiala viscosa TaxID=2486360 RepID=UPI00219056AC|nr:Alpha/Beta hydrolase protein [Exophiala viscosa]